MIYDAVWTLSTISHNSCLQPCRKLPRGVCENTSLRYLTMVFQRLDRWFLSWVSVSAHVLASPCFWSCFEQWHDLLAHPDSGLSPSCASPSWWHCRFERCDIKSWKGSLGTTFSVAAFFFFFCMQCWVFVFVGGSKRNLFVYMELHENKPILARFVFVLHGFRPHRENVVLLIACGEPENWHFLWNCKLQINWTWNTGLYRIIGSGATAQSISSCLLVATTSISFVPRKNAEPATRDAFVSNESNSSCHRQKRGRDNCVIPRLLSTFDPERCTARYVRNHTAGSSWWIKMLTWLSKTVRLSGGPESTQESVQLLFGFLHTRLSETKLWWNHEWGTGRANSHCNTRNLTWQCALHIPEINKDFLH